MSRDSLDRRTVLKASSAAIGLGALGTVAAGAGDGEEPPAGGSIERCGPADVTGVESGLETVQASSVPEAVNGLGPGSMLFISSGDDSGTAGCTANFVWVGADGTQYLGAAGHCFLGDDAVGGSELDDPNSASLSNLTVEACVDCSFGGATALSTGVRGEVVELGDVAYARQEADDGTQVGHDFGLVEIPEEAEHLVDPSMPTWGGPTEVGRIDGGDTVVQYGNGVVTGETVATKSRTGAGTYQDEEAGAWYGGFPAAPGDSGSAVQVADESATSLAGVEAAGVLTHVTAAGVAGTNREQAVEMASEAGLEIEAVLA